jgi:hypothetical protein
MIQYCGKAGPERPKTGDMEVLNVVALFNEARKH